MTPEPTDPTRDGRTAEPTAPSQDGRTTDPAAPTGDGRTTDPAAPTGDGRTADPTTAGRESPTDLAQDSPTDLARELLVATKTGEPTAPYESALAGLDEATLAADLEADAGRLAFWINVYNAYAQLLLERYPREYERSRRRFFGHEAIPVAGEWLSLNTVEHGLLRRSQWPLGLGYVPDPFPSAFERRFRVQQCDWRIHFALNCGAKSCPPIRAYEREAIDDQLDLATESYLRGEVEYDEARGVVRVPRLMLWYRGDFGGGSGIREILREFDCVPADANPTVRYREYDWSKAADAFAE